MKSSPASYQINNTRTPNTCPEHKTSKSTLNQIFGFILRKVPYIMLSSHFVASLVLAGLSLARPHQNHTVAVPIHATTPDPAEAFPIVPTGTVASLNDEISSTVQLSKRQDPPSDDGDWDDVAEGGIKEIADVAKKLLDIFRGGEQETTTSTITITQEPGKPTSTGEPTKTSAPEETVTTVVTSITAPGETITITVVPTTVVPKPEPTESRIWPTPGRPGCSPEDKECDEESVA